MSYEDLWTGLHANTQRIRAERMLDLRNMIVAGQSGEPPADVMAAAGMSQEEIGEAQSAHFQAMQLARFRAGEGSRP